MTGDLPADRLPDGPAANDFAAIPILMEPVHESPDAASPAVPPQIVQQSLFDDPAVPANDPPRRTPRRATPSPELARAAGHILRARAPAIIDEIVAAHTHRLATDLRERLEQELASLLTEMAGDKPA